MDKKVTLNEYQELAMKTAVYAREDAAQYNLLNLGGEVGELQSHYAKAVRKGVKPDLELIRAEMGDILWNLAGLADAYNWKLEDIALENIAKLADRADRGVIEGSGDKR